MNSELDVCVDLLEVLFVFVVGRKDFRVRAFGASQPVLIIRHIP